MALKVFYRPSRRRMLYAASRRPSDQEGNRLPQAVPHLRPSRSAPVPVSVRGFLARPHGGAASVPSGTLQARLLGATALGFRRHSLTVQASEQTGLDALRRIPGDPPRASRETAGGWLSRLGF